MRIDALAGFARARRAGASRPRCLQSFTSANATGERPIGAGDASVLRRARQVSRGNSAEDHGLNPDPAGPPTSRLIRGAGGSPPRHRAGVPLPRGAYRSQPGAGAPYLRTVAPPSGARSATCTFFACRPLRTAGKPRRRPAHTGPARAHLPATGSARPAQLAAWLPTTPDGYHARPRSPIRHREQGPRVARYPHRRQGRFSLREPSGPVRTPMRRTRRPARTRACPRTHPFGVHGPGAGIAAGSCESGPRRRSCLPLAAPQGSAQLRRAPQGRRRRHARYEPPPSPPPILPRSPGTGMALITPEPGCPRVEGRCANHGERPPRHPVRASMSHKRCRKRGIG